jgi:hypothetical protein
MAEAEQKKQPGGGRGSKRDYRCFNQNQESKTSYKSKVVGLEDNVFNVGATSDPAKFSKSIKSIKNYIQKTYKSPDDLVKALQKLKRPTLDCPKQPKKDKHLGNDGKSDEDAYDMIKFAWKEDYKAMQARKDRYNINESNAWALVYHQCTPGLKNKLKGASGYETAKKSNNMVKLLIIIRGYCCQFNSLNNKYMLIIGVIKIYCTISKSRCRATWTTTRTSWQWWRSSRNMGDKGH